MKITLLLSCEHGLNTIPEGYQSLFPDKAILNTHVAIDLGALDYAMYLAKNLHCELIVAKTSRLLVECNRSLNHPKLFSSYTQNLPEKNKTALIETYYLPYRAAVEAFIKKAALSSFVLHLSCHSFTPLLDGEVRRADLGLLYDPKRSNEKEIASFLQKTLQKNSKLKIRKNYPYLGTSDGFTTTLRKKFSNEQYAGIEIEVNQGLVGTEVFEKVQACLLQSIQALTLHTSRTKTINR